VDFTAPHLAAEDFMVAVGEGNIKTALEML
jgi:hypothetical protein